MSDDAKSDDDEIVVTGFRRSSLIAFPGSPPGGGGFNGSDTSGNNPVEPDQYEKPSQIPRHKRDYMACLMRIAIENMPNSRDIEYLMFVFLTPEGDMTSTTAFTSGDPDTVELKTTELLSQIGSFENLIAIVHNHDTNYPSFRARGGSDWDTWRKFVARGADPTVLTHYIMNKGTRNMYAYTQEDFGKHETGLKVCGPQR